MHNRNSEPLLILAFAGLFVLSLAIAGNHFAGNRSTTRALPRPIVQKNPASVPGPETTNPGAVATGNDTLTNSWENLEAFYQALHNIASDQTRVHIAYFGDSMIEGDLVTMHLRQFLQRHFGGTGVGFVTITTPLPGFRTTILQSFNDAWEVIPFTHTAATDRDAPGISGYTYLSSRGARTEFSTPKNGAPFRHASLLFGGTQPVRLKITTDTLTQTVTLMPEGRVNRYGIVADSAFRSLSLRVESDDPGVFYGVNFEAGAGVYVDNYAFRGNSGLPMTAIPSPVFEGFNRILNNRLIILHFGLNVYTPGVDDYHWYEMAMDKVVRHVRESSPGCSILLISMPDRSALINGAYHTPAGLPEFIRLQKRVALREHAAYLDLYDAMGGAESMKNWVEGHPKLAGEDYTHPNGAGAARIASYVFDFLMRGYEHWLHPSDTTLTPKQPGMTL